MRKSEFIIKACLVICCVSFAYFCGLSFGFEDGFHLGSRISTDENVFGVSGGSVYASIGPLFAKAVVIAFLLIILPVRTNLVGVFLLRMGLFIGMLFIFWSLYSNYAYVGNQIEEPFYETLRAIAFVSWLDGGLVLLAFFAEMFVVVGHRRDQQNE
jgi:hypothetical protein